MKHFFVVESADGRFKSEVIARSRHQAKRIFREKNAWIFKCLNIKPKLSAYKEDV